MTAAAAEQRRPEWTRRLTDVPVDEDDEAGDVRQEQQDDKNDEHNLQRRQIYLVCNVHKRWSCELLRGHPVCLSGDNFRKPWRSRFIFAHPVHLQGIRVKFVYEGHRVKVKVTGAKRSKIPISTM